MVIIGICCTLKKSRTVCVTALLKWIRETLSLHEVAREFQVLLFAEELEKTGGLNRTPVDQWPLCDVLLAWYSKGFPLVKAIEYAALRKPRLINSLVAQSWMSDRRRVRLLLSDAGVPIPSAVRRREEKAVPRPVVEKPVDAEDHEIWIYHGKDRLDASSDATQNLDQKSDSVMKTAPQGVTCLFRKSSDRASTFSPWPMGKEMRGIAMENTLDTPQKAIDNDDDDDDDDDEALVGVDGSGRQFIYEHFVPIDSGFDLKVYATSSSITSFSPPSPSLLKEGPSSSSRSLLAPFQPAAADSLFFDVDESNMSFLAQLREAPLANSIVKRDPVTGKQIRLPTELDEAERASVARVIEATGQRICGLDLLRPKRDIDVHERRFISGGGGGGGASLVSLVCDVNGLSNTHSSTWFKFVADLILQEALLVANADASLVKSSLETKCSSSFDEIDFNRVTQLHFGSNSSLFSAIPLDRSFSHSFFSTLLSIITCWADESDQSGSVNQSDLHMNTVERLPSAFCRQLLGREEDRSTSHESQRSAAREEGDQSDSIEKDQCITNNTLLYYCAINGLQNGRSSARKADSGDGSRQRREASLEALRQLPASLRESHCSMPLASVSTRLPQHALWRELATVLLAWFRHRRFPLHFVNPPWMSDQQSALDDWRGRVKSVEAILFSSTISAAAEKQDAGVAGSKRSSRLRSCLASTLRCLGVSGIRRCLRLRSTPGSSMTLLPPSVSELWQRFNDLHRETRSAGVARSFLTVGGRALAKHKHRADDGFWSTIDASSAAAAASGRTEKSGNELEQSRRATYALLSVLVDVCWLNILALPGDLPCLEVRERRGYGARWIFSSSFDGTDEGGEPLNEWKFRGFLEPQNPRGHETKWRH